MTNEVSGANSHIGYLAFGEHIFPITEVRLDDGVVNVICRILPGHPTITIDQAAERTLIGVDGSQIMHSGRTGPPDLFVATPAETITVTDSFTIDDVNDHD